MRADVADIRRVVDGEASLLFGPYAGFTPKFLKRGSWLDLPLSIRFGNIGPMIRAGLDNLGLTWYLITQVLASRRTQFKALLDFMPTAKRDDWYPITAGQRVQVIKKDAEKGGVLQFGVQVPAVVRVIRGFRFSLSTKVEGVRQSFRAFLPVLAGRGVYQISGYVDLLLAGFLAAGAIAALTAAQVLYMLPVSLFVPASAC